MSRRTWLLAGLLAGVLPTPAVRGQTSYPMLTRVEPGAIQRGQSAEITISGTRDFSGASDLLFEGKGLVAEITDAGKPGKPATAIKARVTASADAALGPRELRVVTPRGCPRSACSSSSTTPSSPRPTARRTTTSRVPSP